MIGEEAATAREAADPRLARYATELNEILRRVASIIGDIDVLKRERLSEERARVEQELERIGRPEASDEPRDSGDQADDLQQEGTDDALREDLKQTLEAIERAEARLEEGTYGVSVVSGDPLPDERLEAVPWADRKVDEEPGGRG